MKERPILFSGPMVRAILAGKKTQTRRVIGLPTLKESRTPGYDLTFRGHAPVRSIGQQQRHPHGCWQDMRRDDFMALCPYGAPGDRLWVRETWYDDCQDGSRDCIEYRADHDCKNWEAGCPCRDDSGRSSWRPSIFMPRWACRMVLPVVAVRLERLQDISEEDARAEGIDTSVVAPSPRGVDGIRPRNYGSARDCFADLWDSINGKPRKLSDGSLGPDISWKANPWVWVVSFEVAP